MARDSWVENLRCPNCRKTGTAWLSAADEYSWDIQVIRVPEGFKVISVGDVSNFYCTSCDRPAELSSSKAASVGGLFHLREQVAHLLAGRIEEPDHDPSIRPLMQIADKKVSIVFFDHFSFGSFSGCGLPLVAVFS